MCTGPYSTYVTFMLDPPLLCTRIKYIRTRRHMLRLLYGVDQTGAEVRMYLGESDPSGHVVVSRAIALT